MNMLNIKLQGRDQLVNKPFEHVCAFEVKLRLWVEQLKQCNYANFSTLSASQPNVVFVGQLAARTIQNSIFVDLPANNQAFALFATPFAVTVDTGLKTKFSEVAIVKFY